MLNPDEAWRLIESACRPLDAEPVPLGQALGRVLAEPVTADRDLPPADRSAMDGFAVRSMDVSTAPARLRIVGEIAAGSDAAPVVAPGTCARIFTGANLPPGADGVVMVEHTREADGQVEVLRTAAPGANTLKRGEDALAGAVVVPAGVPLHPLQIAACASVGRASVAVTRVPRVSLIVTGSELLPVGAAALPYQVRDSNGPMLEAALRAEGFTVACTVLAADAPDEILARLREAEARGEATVLTAGVSVGKYDLVPDAIARAGARVRIHGVAMKPGKPFLFAQHASGHPIFGLPGNPLSAATGLHEFVLPALRRMAGLPSGECRRVLAARLRGPLASKGGRRRYALARLRWEQGLEAEPVATHSSADLAAGGQADGALILPADVERLEDGAPVQFRPWRRLP